MENKPGSKHRMKYKLKTNVFCMEVYRTFIDRLFLRNNAIMISFGGQGVGAGFVKREGII